MRRDDVRDCPGRRCRIWRFRGLRRLERRRLRLDDLGNISSGTPNLIIWQHRTVAGHLDANRTPLTSGSPARLNGTVRSREPPRSS